MDWPLSSCLSLVRSSIPVVNWSPRVYLIGRSIELFRTDLLAYPGPPAGRPPFFLHEEDNAAVWYRVFCFTQSSKSTVMQPSGGMAAIPIRRCGAGDKFPGEEVLLGFVFSSSAGGSSLPLLGMPVICGWRQVSRQCLQLAI